MVRTRGQARPAGALPALADGQALELEARVDRHDAVDLAVRVLVVLACVDAGTPGGVEVDGCDGHVEGFGGGEGDLTGVSRDGGRVGRLLFFCRMVLGRGGKRTRPRRYLGPSSSPEAAQPSLIPCLTSVQKSS